MLRMIFTVILFAIAASIGWGTVVAKAEPAFGAAVEAGSLEGSGYLSARIVGAGDDPRALQFDLELSGADEAAEARGALHLAAIGDGGARYGAFLLAADLDGGTFGAVGPQALLPLSAGSWAELRAGIGGAGDGGPDMGFAEATLRHEIAPGLLGEAGLLFADVDGPSAAGTAREARISLAYTPPGRTLGLFAELAQARFDGREDTRLRIGLTADLGAGRADLFRTPRPTAALAR